MTYDAFSYVVGLVVLSVTLHRSEETYVGACKDARFFNLRDVVDATPHAWNQKILQSPLKSELRVHSEAFRCSNEKRNRTAFPSLHETSEYRMTGS